MDLVGKNMEMFPHVKRHYMVWHILLILHDHLLLPHHIVLVSPIILLMLLYPICLSTTLMCPYVIGHFFVQPHSCIWLYYPWSNAVPDGRPMWYRSYRSIFPLLFFDFPRLLKYYLYSIHSLFVWRECLAHQVPIVLTVLSFRFSGLCLMEAIDTIHFHGHASPVGVWSFLRLPLNPSRG